MSKNTTDNKQQAGQTERFDISMDARLQKEVYYEIYKRLYQLKSTESSIDTDDLLQKLKASGIATNKEEKLLYSYQSYWYKEDLTLLQFKNFDCCLCSRSNNIYLKFSRNEEDRITEYNPQEVIDCLLQVDLDMPQFISSCKAAILKEQKKAKMKAMSKATVTAVVKSTLKGTGIKYKLDLNENQAYLTVKLDHDLETKFALSYKDFMKKIVYVVSTVEQLNKIMQNLGQPLRIKKTYFRNNSESDWEESI